MQNEEFFKDIPELNRAFGNLDREIRYYRNKSWNEYTTKERLIERRDALFAIAKNLTLSDLYLLYYVEKIEFLTKMRLLKKLRKHYQSQCRLLNFLENTNEHIDIFLLGRAEKNKNSQKNP